MSSSLEAAVLDVPDRVEMVASRTPDRPGDLCITLGAGDLNEAARAVVGSDREPRIIRAEIKNRPAVWLDERDAGA